MSHTILENMTDAIVVVDTNNTIVLVNSVSEKYFGYNGGELKGKDVECLLQSAGRDFIKT